MATTDASALGNSTSTADPSFSQLFPFSAGLHGVDQGTNWLFIHTTIIIFCGLLLLTLGLRIAKRSVNHIRHIAIMANPQRQAFWETNHTTWWPWLKQHFIYAPLFGARHNRELRIFRNSRRNFTMGTIPGRGQALLLVVYCLCNIMYCVWLPWGWPTEHVIAALRGRSGILAAFNLVPTILFALRNNPLIVWLEISYDTCNMLHRWLARITIALSLVHTLAWFGNTLRAGGWHALRLGFIEKQHGPSFQAGLVGTVAFLIIALQTWSPLRHAFYETFLNIHKLMVALALAGVYMHLKLDRIVQLSWVQVSIAIWLLEYVVRVARIAYHNISWKRGVSRVTVEALPSEACRVTINLAGRPMQQSPGAHSHIYLPALSYASSHPFSIAWIENTAVRAASLDEKLPQHEQDVKRASVDRTTEETRSQVSFVIRARDGFTRNLLNRANSTATGTFTTWGLAEGPYGGRDSLASYGTVLMFAGGVGITHHVSYIRDLITKHAAGVVGTRKITLVWSVPNTEALEWVKPWMDTILRLPGRRDVLTIKLFVTRPRNNREVQSGSGSVQVFPGRCDPQAVVEKAVQERQGAMAVTVCGPGGFADDVRRAVRKRVQVGVVDFVEEAFTY